MTLRSKKKKLISIIIPVYNEGRNITSFIIRAEKAIKEPHEYIVVYDFDEDNTVPFVKKINTKNPIKLIKNKYGRGVTNAVKTGFVNSSGDVYVVMTPDGADDPGVVSKMYKKLDDGIDIVGATRYSKGGRRLEQTSLKSILSNVIGLNTKLLLGIPITDLTNGFKMYKSDVVKKNSLTSEGWEFTMELIIKAYSKGYKIDEVPAVSRKRTYGVSKFKFFRWLPLYLKWLIYGVNLRLQRFK